MPLPLQFMLVILAGWVNRQQCEVIEYLQAENRVLREQLGGRRLRFTNAQRRGLGRHAHSIARSTIRRVLAENGIDPVGGRSVSWRTFLEAHWGAIAATDFFSVDVVTWRGLVRYFVLFVIGLETRRIEIAGISPAPNGAWTCQVARNLTDPEAGFLTGIRYLIHDRDPLFTDAFATTLESSGVHCMKLPPRSPNLNAYAERFVRSIKSKYLAQIIPFGERHLRRAVKEYAEHDHAERNHHGLGNEVIEPEDGLGRRSGPVECRERLGGLLRYYRRAA